MQNHHNTLNLIKKKRLDPLYRKSALYEYQPDFKNQSEKRAISKGIRYNQLSFITGSHQTNLNKLQNGNQKAMQSFVNQNLADIRKKYDELKKIRKNKQQMVKKMKEQLEILKNEENQYIEKKNQGKNLVKIIEDKLQHKKIQFQCKQMDKKSYILIMSRLKNDNIIHSHKINILDKKFQKLKLELKLLNNQANCAYQQSDKTKQVQEKYLRHIKRDRQMQSNHLQILRGSVKQQQDFLIQNQRYLIQNKQISLKAKQDISQKQKQLRRLLNSHLFLKVLTKQKMQLQLNKYSQIQSAFKNIKMITGINNAEKFVQNFLNKEKVYGNLLYLINQTQNQIQFLIKQNQNLYLQNHQLLQQQNQIELGKKNPLQISIQIKRLSTFSQKANKVDLSYDKFMSWILKQIKKINRLQGKNYEVKSKDINIEQYIQIYFKWLNNNMDIGIENPQIQLDMKNEDKMLRKLSKNRQKNKLIENREQQEQQQQKVKNEQIQHNQLEYLNENRKILKKKQVVKFKNNVILPILKINSQIQPQSSNFFISALPNQT